MKIKLCSNCKNGLLCFLIFTIAFTACKKESQSLSQQVYESNTSDIATDGVLTVQPIKRPPTTQQSFIPNGGTATVRYKFTSQQHVLLDSLDFSATADIAYITIGSQSYFNHNGSINCNLISSIDAGSSVVLNAQIHYNDVDSASSGSISRLVLKGINYQTDEKNIHSFQIENGAAAPIFCRVNNIPHIKLQKPQGDFLRFGFQEIIELVLTGDTNWVLQSLPLRTYCDTLPEAFGSRYFVCYNNQKIKVGDMTFNFPQPTDKVVHFTNGFQHVAGDSEVLKIYVITYNFGGTMVTTLMEPLTSFDWADGLGKVIKGNLNSRFYNEQTGVSVFQQ